MKIKAVLFIAALAVMAFPSSIDVTASDVNYLSEGKKISGSSNVRHNACDCRVQCRVENTQVPINASDVKYIPEGRKISVTLEKGSGVFGRLYLEGTNEETGKDYTLTLNIKGTDGEFKMALLRTRSRAWSLQIFNNSAAAVNVTIRMPGGTVLVYDSVDMLIAGYNTFDGIGTFDRLYLSDGFQLGKNLCIFVFADSCHCFQGSDTGSLYADTM